MNNDGIIDASDMELFLANLPNQLLLSSEKSESGQYQTFRIRSSKRETNENNIINIRGINYVTICHQLPIISSCIISTYATNKKFNNK